MLKLKAAICDDDTKHTQDIASKLEQYDVVHDANISYQAFDKPTELLHLYKTGERFDILFLDIETEAINGLTLAEKNKEMDRHAIIYQFLSFLYAGKFSNASILLSCKTGIYGEFHLCDG